MKDWRNILIGCMLTLTALLPAVELWAATNETVTVTAKKKDNPQQNEADIEGEFEDAPTADKDEIHVTNDNVKGKDAGVYNDPVNDGALLTVAQPSGPVKVDVEGRDGIGAIYWVTVAPTGGTGGGQGGEATVLWADVKDLDSPDALVLKDTNSGQAESDLTDSDENTPELYCKTAADGNGDVEFWLNVEDGTYDWVIKQGTTSIDNGTLTSGNGYKDSKPDLAVGFYTLEVTKWDSQTFKRKIDFAIVDIYLFLPEDPQGKVDSENNFFNELTDYPATGGKPRQSKYMYTPGYNPILVEVRGLKSGLGTLSNRLRVASQSDTTGIALTLKEWGENTGIYRNVVPDWTTDQLTLSFETRRREDKVSIKVLNEEVLTFTLLNSGGHSAGPNKTIMIDRAEAGGAWLTYSSIWDDWPELSRTDDVATEFLDGLCVENKNPSFGRMYRAMGDNKCKRSHFVNPTDKDCADRVDFVMWCGHGSKDEKGYYCVFLNGTDTEKLYHEDVGLGDTDAEWVAFNTCRFLNTNTEAEDGANGPNVNQEDIENELKKLCKNGIHLVLGWKTRMAMRPGMGAYFVNRMRAGDEIKDAWVAMTQQYPRLDPAKVSIGRVFGAESCEGDCLEPDISTGLLYPIKVSRDPDETDSYKVLEEVATPGRP